MHDLPTFRERSVREAILNAVAHRDYRHPGSVFIRQYPRRLEVVSPGGFPTGITPENILDKQLPRNRRIAEAFLRCGLVERSGQGANRMLEECIRDSKPLPDYSRSDAHEVFLKLQCEMQDKAFILFLNKIEADRGGPFTSHEYLVFDLVRRGKPIPKEDREILQSLRKEGFIEFEGQGRGTKYMLNPRIYDMTGKPRLMDRESLKKTILNYLQTRGEEGSSLSELLQAFHPLSRDRVQKLLRELKSEGTAFSRGRTKGGRWYFGEEQE